VITKIFAMATIWIALLMPAESNAAASAAFSLHQTPRPMPAVNFLDEQGSPLDLARWKGKVVVLNIWATWCGPCRAEMPTLDRLQARLGSDKFEVVALSIDRAGAGVVRKFYDEIGIRHLTLYIDPTMKAQRTLRIFGLPATLLIGPDGMELGRLIGPAEWDTPEMIQVFEDVLRRMANDN